MVKIKLTILGSGSFPSDLEHYGPAYLLEIGIKKILIDCGMGTNFRLIELGINPNDIDYIFITHLHSDHTTELLPLMMRIFLQDFLYKVKIKPKEVYGPKGVTTLIKELGSIHKHTSVTKLKEVKYKELRTKKSFDNFSVKPFLVQHLKIPSYAYRFVIGDKTIVFSGDTTDCKEIRKAAKNADILIADCSFHKGIDAPVHLNTRQIGDIAKKSGVKKVVLSHLLPSGYDKELVSEVKETFDGEIILAKDKMKIEV